MTDKTQLLAKARKSANEIEEIIIQVHERLSERKYFQETADDFSEAYYEQTIGWLNELEEIRAKISTIKEQMSVTMLSETRDKDQ